ncbi:MAG: hypothetical protein ACPGJS_00695 [Flammeovirgaceae bacterium]
MTIEDVRPEVIAFAIEMEKKLRENEHKGGSEEWRKMPFHEAIERIYEETDELDHVLVFIKPENTDTENKHAARRIVREAADVANFCMMISDKVLSENFDSYLT